MSNLFKKGTYNDSDVVVSLPSGIEMSRNADWVSVLHKVSRNPTNKPKYKLNDYLLDKSDLDQFTVKEIYFSEIENSYMYLDDFNNWHLEKNVNLTSISCD